MYRLALLAFAGLLTAPVASSAQVMPATVVRRGGANGLAMSDGEPISFILEHAQVLDLVDSQRVSLMSLRRRLRAANDPYMRQMDSLRAELGISLEPRERGLSDEDRKKLQRLEQISQPIADSIRINNDAARIQARSLLDSVQVARLDSLTVRERGTIGGRRPPPATYQRPATSEKRPATTRSGAQLVAAGRRSLVAGR